MNPYSPKFLANTYEYVDMFTTEFVQLKPCECTPPSKTDVYCTVHLQTVIIGQRRLT